MKKIIIAAVSLICLCSCKQKQITVMLEHLDSVIAERGEIRNLFKEKQMILKDSLKFAQGQDSMAILSKITENYRYFDVDSLYKYSSMLLTTAKGYGNGEYEAIAKIELAFVRYFREERLEAISAFESIDVSALKSENELINYYECGRAAYKKIDREKIAELDNESARKIPNSQIGIRSRARIMFRNEEYEKALNLLLDCLSNGNWDYREKAIFKLYIANCYEAMGRRNERLKWLIKSAEDDIYSSYRQYSSLKLVADELMDRRRYEEVARYLKICMEDFQDGAYDFRAEGSNNSLRLMEAAILKVNRHYHFAWIITVIVSIGAIGIISIVLRRVVRQRNKIRGMNENLFTINAKLAKKKKELTEANLIRDQYVFQFMNLAKNNIDRTDEHLSRFRMMMKTEGPEALAKELRRQDLTENARKEFYATFDSTFLGLFPEFIDKFNSLLPEEDRLATKGNGELCTEIRIFASIKLGITGSKDIAEFLGYALTTVYTYRTRIKNKALCGKDEFERLLCE